MMLRTVASFSLAILLAACTSETTSGTGQPEGQSQAPAASSTTGGAEAADQTVFEFSCEGAVSKVSSVDLDLRPKCIGGPPNSNTKCGGPSEEACDAQDVRFHYEAPAANCIATDLYEWNGTACVAHSTHGEGGMLRCVGKDCESLFASKVACDAHASACLQQ
jgi:hypothetical protein